MGYIPKRAKWYLAEIVVQIIVESDPRNTVHTNLVLIRADSPEEAYQKAIELGAAHEQSYENPQGRRVTLRFRGLRDLNVIRGELEHGAELIYSEELDFDESAIRKWVTPKEELGVFLPLTESRGPDYRPRDIVEKIYEEFPHFRPDDSSIK
jgi:hypothetical protein